MATRKNKAITPFVGNQYDEIILGYENTYQDLVHLAPIYNDYNQDAYAFSTIFQRIFLASTPSESRSSWTYHTAMAVNQTCQLLNLICKFEALGKRDAIIKSKDDLDVVLVAEWEWDYEDIFGRGKELDKLAKSCRVYKNAEAFLLVYCPRSKYADYLRRIAETWISATKSQKYPPNLFLHTVIFGENERLREFDTFRTVVIQAQAITLWRELYF